MQSCYRKLCIVVTEIGALLLPKSEHSRLPKSVHFPLPFTKYAAKVPVGLSGPAALYDFIYGDQFTDQDEYMEKVYPTRRELEYTYVQKASAFYDLKMIVYTVICIIYALWGKECRWILNELVTDASKTMTDNN